MCSRNTNESTRNDHYRRGGSDARRRRNQRYCDPTIPRQRSGRRPRRPEAPPHDDPLARQRDSCRSVARCRSFSAPKGSIEMNCQHKGSIQMKIQHIASMAFVLASILVVGTTIAAQDRYTLKSPSGISFSEFKGYEAWQAISVSQPDDAGGCGSSPAPGCIKMIVGNPEMIKAYNSGLPANGKSFPDGAEIGRAHV